MFASLEENIKTLEGKLGYTFKDKRLIETALTHSSYANEVKAVKKDVQCNERLEFLGDSVLSLVASVHLFTGNKKLHEGDLTKIRAGVVCENALYDYAVTFDLGAHLLLGHGEENTGGRTRKSILADATEAIIAAIYLDGGFKAARAFILPYIVKAAEALIDSGTTEDYKTLLQKFVQQAHGDLLEYTVTGESGPSHSRTFDVEVLLNNTCIGRGSGSSKREAEQLAAREALILFGEIGSK